MRNIETFTIFDGSKTLPRFADKTRDAVLPVFEQSSLEKKEVIVFVSEIYFV